MKKPIESNQAMGNRVLGQVMNLYVIPEINRRIQSSQMRIPIKLRAAQIIFHSDGGNEIRINSEVKINAVAKLKAPRKFKRGDPVLSHEVDGFENIQLTEGETDCAHITILRLNDKWILAFDARYNKGLIRDNLEVARQFIESAGFSKENEYWSPFVDNLFSAAELIAKSGLLLFPGKSVKESKKHGFVHALYNLQTKAGNIEKSHTAAFNELSRLRCPARYVSKNKFSISVTRAEELLNNVKEMYEWTRKRAGGKFAE